ncbi:MAG: hypothetical protein QW688_07605 [Thermoprotei archaeon]
MDHVRMLQNYLVILKEPMRTDDLKAFLTKNTLFDLQVNLPEITPGTPSITFGGSPLLVVGSLDTGLIQVGNLKHTNVTRGVIQYSNTYPAEKEKCIDDFENFLKGFKEMGLEKEVYLYEIMLSTQLDGRVGMLPKFFALHLKTMSNPRTFGVRIFDGNVVGNIFDAPWREILVQPSPNLDNTLITAVYRIQPDQASKSIMADIFEDIDSLLKHLTLGE